MYEKLRNVVKWCMTYGKLKESINGIWKVENEEEREYRNYNYKTDG